MTATHAPIAATRKQSAPIKHDIAGCGAVVARFPLRKPLAGYG
jgi:hypothetical protein